MTSGCSTLPSPSDVNPQKKAALLCPHPSVYANWATFTGKTEVKQGETAFQTVKRFRVAEQRKNAEAQRLWEGMKACRADKSPTQPDKEKTISEILIGGL